MMKKYIECTLALSILILPTIADGGEWTVYTTADGLIDNAIWLIREDAKGHLWFVSTFEGVSRFDGVRFKAFDTTSELPSNNIYYSLATRDGNIWFATDRGVVMCDGNSVTNLTAADGLAGNAVTFIIEDKNDHLWFATDQGISRYDGATFESFTGTNESDLRSISYILQDADSTLWFAGPEGVINYAGGRFQRVSNEHIRTIVPDARGNFWFGGANGIYRKNIGNAMPEGPLARGDVTSIVEDRNGDLWFASFGAIKYEASGGRFIWPDGLAGKIVNAMLADSRGGVWFGTDEGITRYREGDFENFREINGRKLNAVQAIWQDRDCNLWFGSENGAFKYQMSNLHHFTEQDGLNDNAVEVIADGSDGTLWFGTEKGVCRFDGKAFENFELGSTVRNQNVLSMHWDSRNNLWIGTTGPLYRNAEPFTGSKELTAVRTILEDNSGRLWFATSSGVVLYDMTDFRFFPVDYSTAVFLDSRDRLWIGTLSSGLYLFDFGEDLKHYSMADGLGSNHVNWIVESQSGDLWFGLKSSIPAAGGDEGGRGGLCRFDGRRFQNYTKDNGLISDIINVALAGTGGRLWLGTDGGVMTCDSLREDGSIHFRAITESTGLLSNYIASIYSDRSGKLWFGTDKGVSKFDGHNFQNMLLGDDFVFRSIENIFEDRNGAIWLTGTNSGVIRYTPPAQEIHPRILITQIETDKIYTEQVEAVDIPSDRRLSIAYKAISFKTNPKLMRFQYMLEGHDAGWQASTFETRVHYEELKPATYLFKVRAIDEDLHYSSPPASVNIAVFRPMYLNPWVRGLLLAGGIAAIAGTIYLIVQLKRHRQIAADFREKLHLQKEAERIQRAKMQSLSQLVAGVAHEINNPIGVIAGNNDVINRVALKIKDSLGQNIEDGSLRKAFSILETTNRASKTASDRLAKIVTNLRKFVRLDEAEWQTADIHEGIDSAIALLEAGMPKSIIFDRRYGSLQPAYCSPSSLNQAFMTILRNAADAITEKGKITIKTEMADGRLRIDISDDGIGIPPENLGRIFDPGFTTKGVKVGVGLGLSICYKILVEEHNGHIDVDSEVGKGTTFTVTLPLRSGPKE